MMLSKKLAALAAVAMLATYCSGTRTGTRSRP